MTRTSATRPVVRTAVLAGLVSLAVVSGCTVPEAAPDTPTPRAGEAEPRVVVSAPVTKVAGRISDRERLALRRAVEALVAGYVRAAFLDAAADSSDDADDADGFPGFTEGAARLAEQRGAMLTRADLDVDGATVEVVRAEAPVNVLAPGGRAAGATARLDLELEVTPAASAEPGASAPPGAAGPERVRLTGRLLLTPVGQGWRIFGFDVTRTGR